MNRSQPAKRKLPFGGLQRRVRPRKEEPDLDEIDSDSAASHSSDEQGEDSDDASEAEDDDENAESGSSEDEADEDDLDPSQISFGALAKAQASLPPARRKRGKGEESDEESDDGAPSEEDNAGQPKFNKKYEKFEKRSSKHAPTEVTARRAVTRKREVVPVQKVQARDPRFGPLGGGGNAALQEKAQRENYAFLEQYRDDEMAALRAEIKKTKNPAAKEKLQRNLMSMQSRRQAQQRRDAERAVVEEHRRAEKERVKQGKTPFYLKKSEQKKQLLVDRFAAMKKKDVDKTIEKKRKKLAAKERRELPMERRQR